MRAIERLQKNKSMTPVLLTALLIAAVWAPSASAQSARKDSNTKSAVIESEMQQASQGKELFQAHCASCHFATTTAQKIGPGLKSMYARPFSDGKKVTDPGVAKWIEAGGKDMPGFKETMKPEEIRALISYIKTL